MHVQPVSILGSQQTARPFRYPAATGRQNSHRHALRTQLWTASNANVSDQTIRSRLPEAKLRSPGMEICLMKLLRIRPCLTQANRAACLAWARRHLAGQGNSGPGFSLQMSHGSPCPSGFTLSFNEGRSRVWRRQGECFHDSTVRSTMTRPTDQS